MRRIVIALFAAAIALASAPVVSAGASAQQAAAQKELFRLIDAFRTNSGLSSLDESAFINGEAFRHSKSMARSGKISHKGFNDRFARIRADDSGIDAACENVAFVSGIGKARRAARRIFAGWKKSPPHKDCMLDDAGFSADVAGIGVRKSGARWYATYIAANDTT